METEITCIDIYGNEIKANYKIFEVENNYGLRKLEFRTYLPGDKEEVWFDFKIALIDNSIIKVTDMFIGKEEHRMKGIPEALILEVKRLYNKKVISSSNKKPIILSEWRRIEADKVWKRLVRLNKAKYDELNDIYELL